MKKLFFYYSERHGEFEIVTDEDGNILGGWYSNDANFRVEYFSPFLAQLGFDCLPAQFEDEPWLYRRACRYLDIDYRNYYSEF